MKVVGTNAMLGAANATRWLLGRHVDVTHPAESHGLTALPRVEILPDVEGVGFTIRRVWQPPSDPCSDVRGGGFVCLRSMMLLLGCEPLAYLHHHNASLLTLTRHNYMATLVWGLHAHQSLDCYTSLRAETDNAGTSCAPTSTTVPQSRIGAAY